MKARYYVGFSTIVMAVIGDYVTTRINDEVKARDSIIAQMEYDSQQKKN